MIGQHGSLELSRRTSQVRAKAWRYRHTSSQTTRDQIAAWTKMWPRLIQSDNCGPHFVFLIKTTIVTMRPSQADHKTLERWRGITRKPKTREKKSHVRPIRLKWPPGTELSGMRSTGIQRSVKNGKHNRCRSRKTCGDRRCRFCWPSLCHDTGAR